MEHCHLGISEKLTVLSASQEIILILCVLNVHYCVHRSLSLVPILSKLNQYSDTNEPIHTDARKIKKLASLLTLTATNRQNYITDTPTRKSHQ
jgi:hypothetical protein